MLLILEVGESPEGIDSHDRKKISSGGTAKGNATRQRL